MKILIIIPAFNEAENIVGLLKRLMEVGGGFFDAVVINDASGDNTAALARAAGAEVLDLPFNLGIGGAVQTGYLYAYYNGYDIAVQVDGDGQHDPAYIPALIAPIVGGSADMTVGSRFIECKGYQSTFLRRMGSRYFHLLIWIISGKKFSDPTSGFRACNRRVIASFARYYPTDYPEPETLVAVSRSGYKLVEVPVVMKGREGGHSSIDWMRTVYYLFKVSIAVVISIFKRKSTERYYYDGTEITAPSARH